MKVGVYYRNADVRVEDRPMPVAGPGDVVLKVRACGICGSDVMEWYRIKRAPLVLGHELAGEVVSVGAGVEGFKPGDRVFATHHVPCDACRYCLTGHPTACKVFQEKNNFDPGGFSEFLKVGGRSVATGMWKLPDTMSWDTATFIEPLATAVRAMRTLAIAPGESVMVYGAGIAGILLVKMAKAMGAGTVISADLNEFRLAAAKRAGADLTVNAKENVPAFLEKSCGRLADKVVIAAGALPAARAALESVDRGGAVLFFAVPQPGETLAVDFNPYWRNDIALKTCYGAAPLDNFQATELLRTGTVRVDEMITHRFPLSAIGDAFRTAIDPKDALKVIVEPH